MGSNVSNNSGDGNGFSNDGCVDGTKRKISGSVGIGNVESGTIGRSCVMLALATVIPTGVMA